MRPQVEEGNHGKIVAIDIETEAFEVTGEILTAIDRLFKRIPDAQPWIVRVGHRAVHRFGARSLAIFKEIMFAIVSSLTSRSTPH